MERIDASPKRDAEPVTMLDAKDRVNKALGAVGLMGGDVVWYVVGEGYSLREFCRRQYAAYKCSNQDEARGVLKASLDTLAKHYGLCAS